jgi:hypothetical protein
MGDISGHCSSFFREKAGGVQSCGQVVSHWSGAGEPVGIQKALTILGLEWNFGFLPIFARFTVA